MDDDNRYTLQRLATRIYKASWPTFPCRGCGHGLHKITNLNQSETETSKESHADDNFEPEWIHGNFVAISTCQNCKDNVYIVGTYGVEEMYFEDEDGIPRGEFSEVYTIKYMTPAYQLLRLPKHCPESTKLLIDEASEVFFINPDLCANRIRTSIDSLLTDQKIPRFKTNTGKRRKLATHTRIELLKSSNRDVAGLLEAVKWIGNEGSHGSSLSFADIIDGLEIYGLALDILYDKSTAAIRKKASLINRNKGIKKIPVPF